MDMSDGSQRLILEWEGSEMENGWEAGLHRQNIHSVQLLQQKEKRLQRIAQFLAVAVLIQMSVAVAFLVTAVHGGRGQESPDYQTTGQQMSHSSDGSTEPDNPSAMLTAPRSQTTTGDILQWESKDGNAFLGGGFSYNSSSKHLVVPRAGIYRVFLQITYKGKTCGSEEPVMNLKNMVHLFQETYPMDVLILSSVDNMSCGQKQWSKSLYTAGLFEMEAHSRLHVTSSHRDLIAPVEYQTFFGAELVLPKSSQTLEVT